MKRSLSNISQPIIRYLAIGRRYAAFVCIVFFLGSYVFLVQYIGKLIQADPGQQATAATDLQPIKRLTIDETSIQRINELESQNIDVQLLIKDARNNPFTE